MLKVVFHKKNIVIWVLWLLCLAALTTTSSLTLSLPSIKSCRLRKIAAQSLCLWRVRCVYLRESHYTSGVASVVFSPRSVSDWIGRSYNIFQPWPSPFLIGRSGWRISGHSVRMISEVSIKHVAEVNNCKQCMIMFQWFNLVTELYITTEPQ